MTGSEGHAIAQEVGQTWWVFLFLGIVWVLFGMFVLSYRVGSLLALAVLAGMTFILGVAEFLLGAWAAGYPGRSLLVFVNLVGFYALIHGFTEIFGAFTLRGIAKDEEPRAAA